MNFLTQNITLYSCTLSISTDTGENVTSYSTGTATKGRIRPLSANEQYSRQKINDVSTHRLYCNYSTMFNSKDKIVCGTSTYEITGIINPMNFNRFLEVDLAVVQ